MQKKNMNQTFELQKRKKMTFHTSIVSVVDINEGCITSIKFQIVRQELILSSNWIKTCV